ncbi:MAG: hypothetical protein HY674_03415 [Chloroflexi bacterium]|nr:hypothetical protein [Chloroflexota bacterium]
MVEPEPNVVGIEVWHFPWHHWGVGLRLLDDADLMNAYFNNAVPAMVRAARAQTSKIIFLGAPLLGHFDYAKHPRPVRDTNVVYCSGGYGGGRGTSMLTGETEEAWDHGSITQPHPSWKAFRAKHNVPVMGTEGPGLAERHYLESKGHPARPQ